MFLCKRNLSDVLEEVNYFILAHLFPRSLCLPLLLDYLRLFFQKEVRTEERTLGVEQNQDIKPVDSDSSNASPFQVCLIRTRPVRGGEGLVGAGDDPKALGPVLEAEPSLQGRGVSGSRQRAAQPPWQERWPELQQPQQPTDTV